MNKESKAYKRVRGLDKKGFADHLKQESAEYLKSDPEEGTSGMGTVLGTVAGRAVDAIDWAKGLRESGDSGEFEYEVTEIEVQVEESNEDTGEQSEDPEIIKDPVLIKENMHEALAAVKEAFVAKKTPTFTLPIAPDERTRFREFINWINQTSGLSYIMTTMDDRTIAVTKLPQVNQVSDFFDVSSNLGTTLTEDNSVDESIPFPVMERPYSPAVEVSTSQVSANAKSLIAQLRNGVRIPARSKKGKPKRVTLSNSGLSENVIMGILTDHPKMEMAGLIREMYIQKGTWKLVNNLYDLSKLTIDNP